MRGPGVEEQTFCPHLLTRLEGPSTLNSIYSLTTLRLESATDRVSFSSSHDKGSKDRNSHHSRRTRPILGRRSLVGPGFPPSKRLFARTRTRDQVPLTSEPRGETQSYSTELGTVHRFLGRCGSPRVLRSESTSTSGSRPKFFPGQATPSEGPRPHHPDRG